MSFLTPFLSRM